MTITTASAAITLEFPGHFLREGIPPGELIAWVQNPPAIWPMPRWPRAAMRIATAASICPEPEEYERWDGLG